MELHIPFQEKCNAKHFVIQGIEDTVELISDLLSLIHVVEYSEDYITRIYVQYAKNLFSMQSSQV